MTQQTNPPKSSDPPLPASNAVHANPASTTSVEHSHPARRKLLGIVGGVLGLLALIAVTIWIVKSWNTVSTDDAYVNGHVTLVAARVAGQVARVLVDDNNRVRQGDLLVQIDREPFQVQVNIAKASLTSAQADLVAARAKVHGLAGQARSLRFSLEHSIEDVHNQLALLSSKVAALDSQKATLDNARIEYDRVLELMKTNSAAHQELEDRKEAFLVAKAKLEEALQGIYQVRAGLGLSPKPEKGEDYAHVPADLDQTTSTVRRAQASLIEAAAQLGVTDSFEKTPRQMIADFYKRDPSGNIDQIYAHLMKEAPLVKQAEAKLLQAQRNLDQALLDLRYCDVVAEIDGVITRRNVNPGNNVVSGQALMAIRSLKEIWIDANFKETQLADLRIGQPVDLDVDMYGSRHVFKGRISGFTMGTGSTLALLPPENATGNFVKVVQRLPVRIELTDYDPDKTPLFIGSSVTPRVYVNETPTGPNAGKMLQTYDATMIPASAPETQP